MKMDLYNRKGWPMPEQMLTPAEAEARYYAELLAGRVIKCIPENIGATVCDQLRCSCGWESRPYWDGADLAHNEWTHHIREKGAQIDYPSNAPVLS